MKSNYIFCIQILIFIIIYYIIFNHPQIVKLSYNLNSNNLESCLSLNIPCLTYKPTLWELEQISGLTLQQAIEIKRILDKSPQISKIEFKKELLKIKGIGEKKSNNISEMLFY